MLEVLRSLVLLLSVLAVASCDLDLFGPDASRYGEPIQTDGLAYRATLVGGSGRYARYGFELVATFLNASDRTVYLARCYSDSPHPIYGVSLVDADEGERSGYDPVWACVGHDEDIPVAAGESMTDTLRIMGPNAWDGHTKEPMGVLEGVFRLSYRVSECSGGCGSDPGPSVTSNSFEVSLVGDL